MLICPKCKTEYEEGYTICSDCESKLTQLPQINEDIAKEKMNVKIFSFILGVLIILCSTMISLKLTKIYFFSNGNGEFSMEEFFGC